MSCKVCKWYSDVDICVNDECPVCCDYCPCGEYQEICKYAEMVEVEE